MTNSKDLSEIYRQQIYFLDKSCTDYDNGTEIEAVRIAGHIRTLVHDVQLTQTTPKTTTALNSLENLLKGKVIADDAKFKEANKFIQQLKSLSNKTVTSPSKSLLTQLNLKEGIKYIDSKGPNLINGLSNFTFGQGSIEITSEAFSFPYVGLLYANISVVNNESNFTFTPLFKNKLHNKTQVKLVVFDAWWNGEIFDNRQGLKLSRKDVILNFANKDGYSHVDVDEAENYSAFKQINSFVIPYNDTSGRVKTIPLFPTVRQIAYELQESIKDIKTS
jgi:hypothetical protein